MWQMSPSSVIHSWVVYIVYTTRHVASYGAGGAIATPEEVVAPPGEISPNLGKFRDFSIETHRSYTLFPRPGLIEITGDCL